MGAALVRALVALLAATVGLAGVATASPTTPASVPSDVAAMCGTENPYIVTSCYFVPEPAANLPRRREDLPMLIAFRDTPTDTPHYRLATQADVGSVWGLAYSSADHMLYAAAFHKRSVPFGPGGPGAIYRIDVSTGAIALFATVPNVGPDQHSPGGQSPDTSARIWATETSLGDLDLSDDASQLYVVNLDDRRIYRFQRTTGQLLGSFPHGAWSAPWAEDARPFGLKFHAGRLFHGVVNSSESNQGAGDFAAYVYSSLADGSDMRQVNTFGLRYRRGRADLQAINPWPGTADLQWRAWTNGDRTVVQSNSQNAGLQPSIYPMPVLADIEFDADGNLIVGLHDRKTEVAFNFHVGQATSVGRVKEQSGMGFGDIVLGRPNGGGGWDVETVREHYDDSDRLDFAEETSQGGLAFVPRTNVVVNGATGFGVPHPQQMLGVYLGAFWYDNRSGNRTRREGVCRNDKPLPRLAAPGRAMFTRSGRPLRLDDDGAFPPGNTIGDIELLCGPSPTPTATTPPTATPSPTPTATASPTAIWTSTTTSTSTATRTATPTSTPTSTTSPTATPKPAPIYRPLILREPPCDRVKPRIDVVLVIDASTSMLDRTRAGRPKIDAARDAAGAFLDQLDLPGDQAAIVGFNAAAWLAQPLTGDRAALRSALAGLAVAQFTRIDLGIRAAHDELRSGRRVWTHQPAIVVLTDGRNNPEPVESAVADAAAKADGIRVFTIGLGDDVEVDALVRMASAPGDYHFAPDGEDLAAIYRTIAGAFEPCGEETWWPRRP